MASGQLADGDIKNDLHSLVDFTKKEDQYKTEATTGELGTKNKDVKFFLLTLIRSPPVEKKILNVKSTQLNINKNICELVRSCIYCEFF